jgi:hypothetical protein
MQMATGKGQAFFERHMAYIKANDVEGMVRETYTEDAILFNAFPYLDTPPPNIIQGHSALVNAYNQYVAYTGEISVLSLYNFLDTDDAISFQATLKTANAGTWAAGDCWLMREGKIYHHIGFAHQLSNP